MSPVVAYLIQSVGWAGAGFLAGVLVGRAARDVRRIAAAVTVDDTEGDEDMPDPRGSRPHWIGTASAQTLVALVVVLLGVVTVVQGIVQSDATAGLTRCQYEYSNAFADALEARSQASTDAQDALDELLTTVGQTLQSTDPNATRPPVQRAISEYLAKRQALKAQQAAHPYPAAPRARCP
ncbi:hypothetical protein [Amycolatopsis sp. CA-128772]|uniref:hypothetical protein n=1 Tax=Amycolatopsis sp. CA-128772 TaxID=2073159 RepID=UPI000CD0B31B|nr:hypothetical protein [Amycolatopsis sp. CA-128772]